jgi:ribonuclease T1
MASQRMQGFAGVCALALVVLACCFFNNSQSSAAPDRLRETGVFDQSSSEPDQQSDSGQASRKRPKDRKSSSKLPAGVPEKVGRVLKYVDENKKAPKGYVGGRIFQNRERRLPKFDKEKKPIKYQEWDVNPKVRGRNRGPQRLITGSDGSAFYTPDHYKTFTKIR